MSPAYPVASVFPPLPVGGTPLSALQREVLALKQAKDALILAHNYQCEDIQGVADFVGDSLGLAYKAASAQNSTIVFCGVHFMAETAKIVNPTRRVLLPDLEAGCSLADSCPADKLAALKAADPLLYVVAHPECTEAVREMADMVCSTELMVDWCRRQTADTLIITTEAGMIHRLRKEVPGKTFVAAPTDRCSCNECRFMKMNTLEKVRDCLLNGTPEITLPEDVRAAAEIPLRRMLEWSR